MPQTKVPVIWKGLNTGAPPVSRPTGLRAWAKGNWQLFQVPLEPACLAFLVWFPLAIDCRQIFLELRSIFLNTIWQNSTTDWIHIAINSWRHHTVPHSSGEIWYLERWFISGTYNEPSQKSKRSTFPFHEQGNTGRDSWHSSSQNSRT